MPKASPSPTVVQRYGPMAAKLALSVVLLVLLLSRIDVHSLWDGAARASVPWLILALGIYTLSMAAGAWRWQVLLNAQHVRLGQRSLFGSMLVASFFNNFLPSNIGGDVIRIRDTAGPAQSKTLATMVVLVDRGLGLMGLVLIAALGATMLAGIRGHVPSPIWPSWLWASLAFGVALAGPALYAPDRFGRLLQPLTFVHPEWVGKRIASLTSALGRFRERPGALASCFGGAIVVQGLLVVFYMAVVHALHLTVSPWDLAVIVPVSFVVQMLPVSLNGFGVREATFSFYFARLGLPMESAILLSLVAAALTMLFSLSGAAVYVTRGR
jgi:glycosyltransferase 2 family protein